METDHNPEQIIKDLGGCGRFQIIISVIANAIKVLFCWTATSMVIIAKTPSWWCVDNATNATVAAVIDTISTNVDWNRVHPSAILNVSLERNTSVQDTLYKSCTTLSGKRCTKFKFAGRSTIVSEFNLVCDYDYIPSLIMSLVAAGACVGNPLAGQISDLFGRKKPFFAAVLLVITANIACYLSTSWTLFAVARFFSGIGQSAFFTVNYSLLSEFTLSRDRAWVVGIPTWSLQSSIFAGLACLLQEWRYIQLACVLVGLPCLLAWWIIPESFRFHLAHDKQEAAGKVLEKVAKFNKKPRITQSQQAEINLVGGAKEKDRRYTFVDIFRTKYLLKVTLLLSINWFTLGFATFGIQFGIQAMSGNIFMNMFLFSVNGIPAKFIAIWLENRFGRRATGILAFVIVAIGGYVAGIVNYIDTQRRGALVNGFALLADTGLAIGWASMQTITIELYPTVIRNREYCDSWWLLTEQGATGIRGVGNGTLTVLSEIGSIIGPQFVFLSTKVPGILYLTVGIFSTISIFTLFGLTETRNKRLSDRINEAEDLP